jgi:mono/diheme cytochrome c family protein
MRRHEFLALFGGEASRTAAPVRVALALLSPIMTQPTLAQTPAAAAFKWQELGTRVFEQSCGVCHQPTGLGVPGAFPPLAGHVAESFAQPNGRAYLVRVVLYGLEGPITVKGSAFAGAMPPWTQLKDDEIAAALDHVLTAWGNDKVLPRDFVPILPADVAAARAQPMTAADVLALRQQIMATRPGGVAGAAPAAVTTALSFTAEQAERGEAAYMHNCQDCHGTSLDNGEFGGAPLKGSWFRQHWGNGSVAALIGKTKGTMPPDRPGQLSDQTYLDLIAFLLSQNGYAPGDKELPADVETQQTMSLKK